MSTKPDWYLQQRGNFTELHAWLAHHAPKDPNVGVSLKLGDYLAITGAITALQARVDELEQGIKKRRRLK